MLMAFRVVFLSKVSGFCYSLIGAVLRFIVRSLRAPPGPGRGQSGVRALPRANAGTKAAGRAEPEARRAPR